MSSGFLGETLPPVTCERYVLSHCPTYVGIDAEDVVAQGMEMHAEAADHGTVGPENHLETGSGRICRRLADTVARS